MVKAVGLQSGSQALADLCSLELALEEVVTFYGATITTRPCFRWSHFALARSLLFGPTSAIFALD